MAAHVESHLVYCGLNYFDIVSDNWTLVGAFGTRSFNQPVTFTTPFSSTPVVWASLASVMLVGGKDLKIDIAVGSINTSGFICTIKTWDDCQIFGVGFNWTAITLA
jgi:hypothetical protein